MSYEPVTSTTTSLRRRVFAALQFLMSIMVLLGSTFEVLNLLFPSLLPEIQEVPLMRFHHSQRVVFAWTLASNLVSLGLAIVLIRGAIGTYRRKAEASRLSLRAIQAFLVVLAGAALVSALYLLPLLLGMLHDGSQRTMGLILLVSVVSSLGGLAVMLSLLLAGHRYILRQDRRAAV